MNSKPVQPTTPTPVFVVGLSRSGTKLLRELLNRQVVVRIPPHESHFIPTLVDAMEKRHTTIDSAARRDYLRHLKATGFYENMLASGYPAPDDAVLESPGPACWGDLIDLTFRHFLSLDDPAMRWGDKSPSYVGHMPALRRCFPGARFVHIVRDPRDRAASAAEAFGANPLLACQRWLDAVSMAEDFARTAPDRYLFIRYEDLVRDTEDTLHEVCRFLCIPAAGHTCAQPRAIETRGDVGNATRWSGDIHTGRIGRFNTSFSPGTLRRMEAIVFPRGGAYGYRRACNDQRHRPLTDGEWILAAPGHYRGALRVFTRRFGNIRGMRRAWQRFRHSRPTRDPRGDGRLRAGRNRRGPS